MKRLLSLLLLFLVCISIPIPAQNLETMRRQMASQQTSVDSLRHVLRGLEKNMEEARQRQFEDSERIRDRARQDYGYYVQHVSWVMGLFGVVITLLVAIVGFLVPFMYNKMLRNDLEKYRTQAVSAAEQVQKASKRMEELEAQIGILQNQLEEMKSIRDTVKRIQKKIEISEKATQEAAQQAEVSKLFAEAYNEKDYKKQIELYTKLIDLDPNVAVAYFNRGYAYDETQVYDKALADYNKAIELKPEDVDAYCNRGIVYRHLGDKRTAFEDFNKAIELDPNNVVAYCNRGIAYLDLGNNQKALADLDKAIELNPKEAVAFNNRANVYLKQHRTELALADIRKAFELEKEDADQYDTRGCIYLEMREYDSAIKDFTKAIELSPKEKEFYENRAKAYRELAGVETEAEKQQTYREAEEADQAMVRKLGEAEAA